MSTMTLTTSTPAVSVPTTSPAQTGRATRCQVIVVPRKGMYPAGYRAVCDSCGYHSYRYDQQITADLVADTHEKTNCFRRALHALTS